MKDFWTVFYAVLAAGIALGIIEFTIIFLIQLSYALGGR